MCSGRWISAPEIVGANPVPVESFFLSYTRVERCVHSAYWSNQNWVSGRYNGWNMVLRGDAMCRLLWIENGPRNFSSDSCVSLQKRRFAQDLVGIIISKLSGYDI